MFLPVLFCLLFINNIWALSFFATTTPGLEIVLEHELRSTCGAQNTMIKNGVHFEGDETVALKAIMYCRTSLKVMEKITESSEKISTKDDLYSLIAGVDWEQYMYQDSTLKCDTVLGQGLSNDLSHSHFNSLTVKNAIVDQWRNKVGSRPNVDLDNPFISLLLYLHRGKATLYRVWSGELSMHKRGYRDVMHKAALRETTAAGATPHTSLL